MCFGLIGSGQDLMAVFVIFCEFLTNWATASLSRRRSSVELLSRFVLLQSKLRVGSSFSRVTNTDRAGLERFLCLVWNWLYEVKLDSLRNEVDCRPISSYFWYNAYSWVYRQHITHICCVGCALSRRARHFSKTTAVTLLLVRVTQILWSLTFITAFWISVPGSNLMYYILPIFRTLSK